jgi:membrane glycosyltransferase
VLQIIFGLDGGWPATKRSEGRLGLDQAFAASWWIMVTACLIMAIALAVAPALVPWLLPVAAPALAAPLLISLTSRSSIGNGRPLFFLTPAEIDPPQVVLDQQRILSGWTTEETSLSIDASTAGTAYVRA